MCSLHSGTVSLHACNSDDKVRIETHSGEHVSGRDEKEDPEVLARRARLEERKRCVVRGGGGGGGGAGTHLTCRVASLVLEVPVPVRALPHLHRALPPAAGSAPGPGHHRRQHLRVRAPGQGVQAACTAPRAPDTGLALQPCRAEHRRSGAVGEVAVGANLKSRRD